MLTYCEFKKKKKNLNTSANIAKNETKICHVRLVYTFNVIIASNKIQVNN